MSISRDSFKKANIDWFGLIILPAWLLFSFFLATMCVASMMSLFTALNLPITKMNESVQNIIVSTVLYVLVLIIAIFLPLFVRKQTIKLKELGLGRLLSWSDMLIAPAGLILYLILTVILTTLASTIFPWFNADQTQVTGFEQIGQRFEYIIAFVTLVVLAPFVEEILFRGYLYGKLKKYAPVWLAILVTSLTFGVAHGAWNLGVDTFALSILLCILREYTGSIWASILLHMMKNGLAYFCLFIYPLISATIK